MRVNKQPQHPKQTPAEIIKVGALTLAELIYDIFLEEELSGSDAKVKQDSEELV